jgi:hypothetical protein
LSGNGFVLLRFFFRWRFEWSSSKCHTFKKSIFVWFRASVLASTFPSKVRRDLNIELLDLFSIQ